MPLANWNRRQWLAGSVATAAAVCSGSLSAAELPKDLEIIDCHTHFYDPTRPEGVPWPDPKSKLYRTVLPHHLREQEQYLPLTGTVIVEASLRVADNTWLLELAKDDPFIKGIVGRLHPGTPEYAADVRHFAKFPLFRGIRISVQVLTELLDKNNLGELKLLADHDLELDVNGGPETPAVVDKLAGKMPALRIVLNHIGNVAVTADPPPADWQAGIRAAAGHPNVFCKISALVEGASRNGHRAPDDLDFYRPYIDVVWNAFGDDRVIYGSNWPVSENAADYKKLQRIVCDYAREKGDAALRKFCALNALAAYKWVRRD